ncbi:MAG: LysM domain-containing protein, partial [Pseudomonadota bacterium]
MSTVDSASNAPDSHSSDHGGQDHTVQSGESLSSIASQYGVSPSDIAKSNPSVVNANDLNPGQTISIPAPTNATTNHSQTGQPSRFGGSTFSYRPDFGQSQTQPSTDATGTSTSNGNIAVSDKGFGFGVGSRDRFEETTDTQYGEAKSASQTSQGVTVGPVDGEGVDIGIQKNLSHQGEIKNSSGYGVQYEVAANANVSTKNVTKDGMVTYSNSVDVSVSVKAGASIPQGGFKHGVTEGVKAEFEVSLPENTAANATLESVNPYNPDSIPEGTTITLDGARYSTTEFSATFKNLATQTKVTDETGVSVAVQKSGPTQVTVTAGPTEGVRAHNGVGLQIGDARATLSRSDVLSNQRLTTAEFDLSNPAGRTAYNDFLATGTLPTHDQPGVSSVSITETFDFRSATSFNAQYKFVETNIPLTENTTQATTTFHSDGTVSRVVDLQYSENVPLSVSQSWDATGTEVVSARQYSYTLELNETTAAQMNQAIDGSVL